MPGCRNSNLQERLGATLDGAGMKCMPECRVSTRERKWFQAGLRLAEVDAKKQDWHLPVPAGHASARWLRHLIAIFYTT